MKIMITVCPGQMGGLPTPRVPAEICKGWVKTREGRIVDKEFRAGAQKCLEIAKSEMPDLLILHSRSPSCGVKQRYDGTFSGTLTNGAGITAELLMKHSKGIYGGETLRQIVAKSKEEKLCLKQE